jgi:hypothetical protein
MLLTWQPNSISILSAAVSLLAARHQNATVARLQQVLITKSASRLTTTYLYNNHNVRNFKHALDQGVARREGGVTAQAHKSERTIRAEKRIKSHLGHNTSGLFLTGMNKHMARIVLARMWPVSLSTGGQADTVAWSITLLAYSTRFALRSSGSRS